MIVEVIEQIICFIRETIPSVLIKDIEGSYFVMVIDSNVIKECGLTVAYAKRYNITYLMYNNLILGIVIC